MAQTTIRIDDELHQELSDVTYEKRKADKNWSMNKEITLRLESYNGLIKRVGNLIRGLDKGSK